jgi:hypothetical protein
MKFPRWLSWMFVAVMGYMIFAAGKMHQGAVQPVAPLTIPSAETTQEVQDYTALANLTDTERWKRALDPSYGARMNCSVERVNGKETLLPKVIEEVVGQEGDAAQCGQSIRIALVVWNSKGGKAYQGELPLALGSQNVAAGLDAGLVGMKIGGVRTLVLPPQALVRSKESKPHAAARKALPEGAIAVVTVQRLADAKKASATAATNGQDK